MDSLDTVLAILKAVGICSTAIFAVLGMVHDFKDEEGNITKWGKTALGGAAFSALLSMIIHGVEVNKAKQDAEHAQERTQEELARNREVLQAIQRGLERVDISKITTDVAIAVSVDDPVLAGFRTRLEPQVVRLQRQLGNSTHGLAQMQELRMEILRVETGKGARDVVTIFPGSPYWPSAESADEMDAASFIGYVSAVLTIRKPSQVDPRDDVMLILATSPTGRTEESRRGATNSRLSFDTRTRVLHYSAYGLPNLAPSAPSSAFLGVVDFDESAVELEMAVSNTLVSGAPSLSLSRITLHFGPNLRSLHTLESPVKAVGTDKNIVFRSSLAYRSSPASAAASGVRPAK